MKPRKLKDQNEINDLYDPVAEDEDVEGERMIQDGLTEEQTREALGQMFADFSQRHSPDHQE
jgi:hypothetical protein